MPAHACTQKHAQAQARLAHAITAASPQGGLQINNAALHTLLHVDSLSQARAPSNVFLADAQEPLALLPGA